MGRMKEMYDLMNECSSINKYISMDEVIRLDREGVLDSMLYGDDDYSYEEDENRYQTA